jgi:hypothetical protein
MSQDFVEYLKMYLTISQAHINNIKKIKIRTEMWTLTSSKITNITVWRLHSIS